MDGLPSNPSDQNGNNGSSKIAVPPPFGSSFSPPQGTIDPSPLQPPQVPQNLNSSTPSYIPNPQYEQQPSIHSEVATHRPRDQHGHFLPYEHPTNSDTPPDSPNSSSPPDPSRHSSFLPPIIEVNQNSEPTYKKDPPAFGFFITNPVTYFKAFLNKLIKRQAITIKIPVLAILIIMVGIGGVGVGFQAGINWALFQVFPNYSPILHRGITEQGIIQKSTSGEIFLKADDKKSTIWTLKSATANVNLEDYLNQHVQIRGNLDATPNLIEVSEVISFNKTTP